VSVKRGIYLAPFDELVDPRTLAELASNAEQRGWNGFFLIDGHEHPLGRLTSLAVEHERVDVWEAENPCPSARATGR